MTKLLKGVVVGSLSLVTALGVTAFAACGGEEEPQGTAQRFEAEYAEIEGMLPGFMAVFMGLSEDCWCEPADAASNGYFVSNLYKENEEEESPTLTFTIVSDVEAEAEIKLSVGTSWYFNDSFQRAWQDTNVAETYPMTFNGQALTPEAVTLKASDQNNTDLASDGSIQAKYSKFTAVSYGTVTLKPGENTFVITGTTSAMSNAETTGSKLIDYLEITTTATLTWTKVTTNTYSYTNDLGETLEETVPVN